MVAETAPTQSRVWSRFLRRNRARSGVYFRKPFQPEIPRPLAADLVAGLLSAEGHPGRALIVPNAIPGGRNRNVRQE